MLLLEEIVEKEVDIYNLEGNTVGKIKLPKVFYVPIRKDIIRRAVLALQTSRLQPKGTDPEAGERTTAESWGVGRGVARVPRIKGSSRAALAPNVVGGRRAHPPRVEKKIKERINKKEKIVAFLSALSATANKDFVRLRGHIVDDINDLPIIVEDDLENIEKSKDLREFFKKIGLWNDVFRAYKNVRVRAGRGKMRGRKYKKPKSVLIVVSKTAPIFKAGRNFPGVEIKDVYSLNVEDLAPGGDPGRLTLFTVSAIRKIEERYGDKIVT